MAPGRRANRLLRNYKSCWIDSWLSPMSSTTWHSLMEGRHGGGGVGTAGIANPQTKERMTVQHQFRTASVTKTFTAVVVLQLIEEKHFSLDSTLATLLKDGLPGGYAVNDLHFIKERLETPSPFGSYSATPAACRTTFLTRRRREITLDSAWRMHGFRMF